MIIIAVSESRLKITDKNDDYNLPGFQMFRFDGSENFGVRSYNGIVIYTREEFIDLTHCVFDGIATVLATFLHRGQMIRIFFLYCPPQKSSIASFTKYLQTILQDIDASSEPVIILGDTNIDFFDQKVLSSSLHKFKLRQIMHCSTTDYDTCLDHVYTSCMSDSDISCATLESYYSDHKPIVVYLPHY